MKSNKYQFWSISLRGQVDGALAEADELESEVDFNVHKIVVQLDESTPQGSINR